jgi:hypothetical protein
VQAVFLTLFSKPCREELPPQAVREVVVAQLVRLAHTQARALPERIPVELLPVQVRLEPLVSTLRCVQLRLRMRTRESWATPPVFLV